MSNRQFSSSQWPGPRYCRTPSPTVGNTGILPATQAAATAANVDPRSHLSREDLTELSTYLTQLHLQEQEILAADAYVAVDAGLLTTEVMTEHDILDAATGRVTDADQDDPMDKTSEVDPDQQEPPHVSMSDASN